MLLGQRCRFFPTDPSKPYVFTEELQHPKRKQSMMARIDTRLQRDRIYNPMEADSVPCLQHRQNYYSMMAVHVIVLQRSRIHRRMMATSGSNCHLRNTIYCRFPIYTQTNPNLMHTAQKERPSPALYPRQDRQDQRMIRSYDSCRHYQG